MPARDDTTGTRPVGAQPKEPKGPKEPKEPRQPRQSRPRDAHRRDDQPADTRSRDGQAAEARPRTARVRGGADQDRQRVRRPRMHGLLGLSSTRRAAVLALVIGALALSAAVPLRNYLAQRAALQDTVQQQENLREQVDGLERRKAELSDPAQLEIEARERLRYVKPGETPYVVQLPTTTPAPPPADKPAEEPRAAPGDQWYGQLWRSVAPGTS